MTHSIIIHERDLTCDGCVSSEIVPFQRSDPFAGYNSSLSASTPYLSAYSTYGGTQSGYGGIHVPASPYNLSVPSLTGLGSLSPLSRSPNTSQLPSRSSSFNRQRSRSRVRAVASGGGVKKRTLSEGYQSGGESEPPSRLHSQPPEPQDDSSPTSQKNFTPNGEIDYKKLYEESMVENERLRGKLKKVEEELVETKATAEKNAAIASRNSMSESEKRERRAMERKLSEMEEELKQLQKLKSENERLKAENRALTRVVSKLTSSHIK